VGNVFVLSDGVRCVGWHCGHGNADPFFLDGVTTMAHELTPSLLESVEYAAKKMAENARVLRDSHYCESGWDSETIHQEYRDCTKHAYRLECFAKTLSVVLRRIEIQSGRDRECGQIAGDTSNGTGAKPHGSAGLARFSDN